jgi:hypothetical protein
MKAPCAATPPARADALLSMKAPCAATPPARADALLSMKAPCAATPPARADALLLMQLPCATSARRQHCWRSPVHATPMRRLSTPPALPSHSTAPSSSACGHLAASDATRRRGGMCTAAAWARRNLSQRNLSQRNLSRGLALRCEARSCMALRCEEQGCTVRRCSVSVCCARLQPASGHHSVTCNERRGERAGGCARCMHEQVVRMHACTNGPHACTNKWAA